MIVYRALRSIALFLRYLQVQASQLAVAASTRAASLGDAAKGAAARSLARQEDRAYDELDVARRHTEIAMEALLLREDMARDNLQETLRTNAAKRRSIFNEVI